MRTSRTSGGSCTVAAAYRVAVNEHNPVSHLVDGDFSALIYGNRMKFVRLLMPHNLGSSIVASSRTR